MNTQLVELVIITMAILSWMAINDLLEKELKKLKKKALEIISLPQQQKSISVLLNSQLTNSKLTEYDSDDLKNDLEKLMNKELAHNLAAKVGNDELRLVTKAISILEALIFSIGFSYLLISGKSFDQSLKTIVALASGWLLIKVIGNYSQWSLPITGRAYFYIFLIGSLCNIFLSSIIGIAVFVLLSSISQ